MEDENNLVIGDSFKNKNKNLVKGDLLKKMVMGDGKQVMTMTKATCPTQLKYTQQNFPM